MLIALRRQSHFTTSTNHSVTLVLQDYMIILSDQRTSRIPLRRLEESQARVNYATNARRSSISPGQGSSHQSYEPFERLNVDFKGPLLTSDKNRYFLIWLTNIHDFHLCSHALMLQHYIHSGRGASFMREELRTFIIGKGVAISRTEGNGEVERYNGIIWKGIVTSFKSMDLPVKYWQEVLADALHSVLLQPGAVLVKRQVRSSKHDPLVDKVELPQANPHYAQVRYPNCR